MLSRACGGVRCHRVRSLLSSNWTSGTRSVRGLASAPNSVCGEGSDGVHDKRQVVVGFGPDHGCYRSVTSVVAGDHHRREHTHEVEIAITGVGGKLFLILLVGITEMFFFAYSSLWYTRLILPPSTHTATRAPQALRQLITS